MPKRGAEEEGRMTKKQCLNVYRAITQVSVVSLVEFLSPTFPVPKMSSLHASQKDAHCSKSPHPQQRVWNETL